MKPAVFYPWPKPGRRPEPSQGPTVPPCVPHAARHEPPCSGARRRLPLTRGLQVPGVSTCAPRCVLLVPGVLAAPFSAASMSIASWKGLWPRHLGTECWLGQRPACPAHPQRGLGRAGSLADCAPPGGVYAAATSASSWLEAGAVTGKQNRTSRAPRPAAPPTLRDTPEQRPHARTQHGPGPGPGTRGESGSPLTT